MATAGPDDHYRKAYEHRADREGYEFLSDDYFYSELELREAAPAAMGKMLMHAQVSSSESAITLAADHFGRPQPDHIGRPQRDHIGRLSPELPKISALAPKRGSCRTDAHCGYGEEENYCDTPIGMCGGVGSCRSTGGSCGGELVPVCGCNGVSYTNPCWARRAGVAIAAMGSCDTE